MNKLIANTKEEIKNETTGGNPMINNMRKQLKNEKGLTLIELLAVIVILAIIAAIAIPAIGNIITNSKYNAAKADALNVLNAAQMYYLDNPEAVPEDGKSTTSSVLVSKLIADKYLESPGKVPKDATVSSGTPHSFGSASILFAAGKTVVFDGATIEMINADIKKGSEIVTTHTIPQITQ